MRKVAVIGIEHNHYMGMGRLIDKLRRSMNEPDLTFFQCGSSGWELYNKLLGLKVDKVIVIDQFTGDEEDGTALNYIAINERILIVGINPIFFEDRIPPVHLRREFEQITFQIKRLILNEICLDSVAQV